jgi:acetyl-CoA C-acetyltransferase
MGTDAVIVGWGHTPFGRCEEDLEGLIRLAGREALDHAGLPAREVGGIWLGLFGAGMTRDGFAASLALSVDDDLRFTPCTRLENACASGSAAIHAARAAIRAGDVRVALVIGAEKMTATGTPGVTEALMQAGYAPEDWGQSFPQIFARLAQGYFQAHGDKSASLARIAAKNHRNALANPLAHLRRDLGFEACNTVSEKNPLIAPPLRLSDCSLISDGAAALVLVADDMAGDFDHAIGFRAAVQVSDWLPMSRRDMLAFPGPTEAFRRAYEKAGVGVEDLDFAEVHDCFTIAELLTYEAMGLVPRGEGARAIDEGWVLPEGRVPVNLSGGLKAKGHPVGATGVSMHVMAARQLAHEAGGMQRPGAELGLVFNMGGSGVANYVSILERTGGRA